MGYFYIPYRHTAIWQRKFGQTYIKKILGGKKKSIFSLYKHWLNVLGELRGVKLLSRPSLGCCARHKRDLHCVLIQVTQVRARPVCPVWEVIKESGQWMMSASDTQENEMFAHRDRLLRNLPAQRRMRRGEWGVWCVKVIRTGKAGDRNLGWGGGLTEEIGRLEQVNIGYVTSTTQEQLVVTYLLVYIHIF